MCLHDMSSVRAVIREYSYSENRALINKYGHRNYAEKNLPKLYTNPEYTCYILKHFDSEN